jgi:hypothetical protein
MTTIPDVGWIERLSMKHWIPATTITTCLLVSLARDAHAQPAPGQTPPASDAPAEPAVLPIEPTPEAPPLPPPPKKPPYSLPWQLRPAAAASVARSDTAFAFRKVNGQSGTTVASMLALSYKATSSLAPIVRLGLVNDSPPTGDAGSAFLNPVVGATYSIPLGPALRLALFAGVTVPVGAGGGNTPDKATRAALAAGILARSAMDNAMFAVNYLIAFPGVDLALVLGGFTAQVEATVFQLTRVRGDLVDKDSSRTNFTSGLHVGYFVVPMLSFGAELRYQAWLSNPALPDGDPRRDTATFAVGPRLHLKLSDAAWLRPGIAYARALDKPMTDQDYNIVQVDIPFAF